jgi:ribonuclease BN (tRNA processing enzyme)
MHPDHYYGLFALSNRLHAERRHQLPLFLPPNGSQVLQDMAQAMGFDYDHMLDCFELSEYNPTRPPFLIGLTIQMKQTKHSINAYAMRLSESASGNHLVFTSDTAWFDGLAEFCLGAQLLLVEATEYPHPPASESVEHWHLTPEEAGRLIMEAQVEKALVTHYDAKYSEAVLSAASGGSLTGQVVLAREHEEYVL